MVVVGVKDNVTVDTGRVYRTGPRLDALLVFLRPLLRYLENKGVDVVVQPQDHIMTHLQPSAVCGAYGSSALLTGPHTDGI